MVPSDLARSGDGLLCGHLEAKNNGWIGIGVSLTESMAGSQAIIGIPAKSTVLKYDLSSYSSVTPMSDDRQMLSDTSDHRNEWDDGNGIHEVAVRRRGGSHSGF